jgi:hypothetical protein
MSDDSLRVAKPLITSVTSIILYSVGSTNRSRIPVYARITVRLESESLSGLFGNPKRRKSEGKKLGLHGVCSVSLPERVNLA